METSFEAIVPLVRSNIGSRVVGGKLCLLNQKRAEGWICGGSSVPVWQGLCGRHTIASIASELQLRYGISQQKALHDVDQFVQQLCQRQIVDIPESRQIHGHEQNAVIAEEPHNRSGRMFDLATAANTLYKVWIDLLVPCNLRCRHCYLDFRKGEIMPREKLIDVVNQLAEHGTAEIILTGGEIFLRKDLLEIIGHVESRGFLFDLNTNGTWIDRAMADELCKFAIQAVQISIYGTNAAAHEAITRKPGTFERSVNAARMLVERGVRVRLACHIQRDNFAEAFEFPKFAQSIGATYEFETKLIPNRNGSLAPIGYGVTAEQQAEAYRAKLIKQPKAGLLCPAAVSKARISAAGDIYPCELIDTVVVGNVYDHQLAEIWTSAWRTNLRDQILNYKPARCGTCELWADCVPCAAMRGFRVETTKNASVFEACLLTTADLLSRSNVRQ